MYNKCKTQRIIPPFGIHSSPFEDGVPFSPPPPHCGLSRLSLLNMGAEEASWRQRQPGGGPPYWAGTAGRASCKSHRGGGGGESNREKQLDQTSKTTSNQQPEPQTLYNPAETKSLNGPKKIRIFEGLNPLKYRQIFL